MATQFSPKELEKIKKLNIDINTATEEQLKFIKEILEAQKESIKSLEI